jgi:nitronate monooxygenase
VSVIGEQDHPIVLAPLAGGPSTPELVAAVNAAKGFGFLAAGYLSAGDLAARIRRTREMTADPFGVNVFVPGEPSAAGDYQQYADHVRKLADRLGLPVGEPRYDDDDWEAKIELLVQDPVAVTSFTFGCPSTSVIRRLQAAGSEVWVTVTGPDEAQHARESGADGLVLQGIEAGGHRGSFANVGNPPSYGLLALLQLTRDIGIPRVAAGGIGHGSAVAAVLAMGAVAASAGTAFLRCPEAGTSAPHRAALDLPGETDLTSAFTGRLARGIRNRFMDELDPHAAIAYPEIHHLTARLRAEARSAGDPSMINLWAGQTFPLGASISAAQVVTDLASAAAVAAAATHRRLSAE